MRILAVSDQVVEQLHSPAVSERFAGVNLIVGCGDLPVDYLDYLASMLNLPLLSVPGNHDLPRATANRMAGSSPPDDWRGCGNIDGQVLSERGVLIAGLGGSVRYRPDGVHQYTQREMARRILRLTPRLVRNRIRYGRFLDILVTHAPPLGVHDGVDPAHVGFRSFHGFIARFRPRYLFHGHSHVYQRDTITRTQLGPTTVLNVCPYRVITLEEIGA